LRAAAPRRGSGARRRYVGVLDDKVGLLHV
jgi:hypothetical protein